jgi:hypothetical protein
MRTLVRSTRVLSHRVVLSVAVAATLAGALPRPARATCGSTQCFFVTDTQSVLGQKGRLTLDLSYRYVPQSRMLAGWRDVTEVLTPKVDFEAGVLEPDHHREIRTQNTLVQLELSYGLSERLALTGILPLINTKDHEHFDDVGTPQEHFTGTDGTSGFGDAQIGVRAALLVRARDLLLGGLSLKLPTGQYRLRDGEGAINEPGLQPGTGSTDLAGSLQYVRQLLPMRLEAFVSGSYRGNRENDLDYALGDEATLNVGIRHHPGQRFGWSLQVNARRAARDRFRGRGVPSTGSTLVNLTPGVRLQATGGTVLYAHVQLPVQQRVNEAQLAPRIGLVLGVARTW